MSASRFGHLLAIIQGDETLAVLERATELAEAENARLTLAQTTVPGRSVSCVAPTGGFAALSVTDEEIQADAAQRLARATAFVPHSIPLTTVVLAPRPARSLRPLVESGGHDLLIAGSGFLARNRKLRQMARDLGISTLAVSQHRRTATRA